MTSFLNLAYAANSALAKFRSLIAYLIVIKNESDSQSARFTNFLHIPKVFGIACDFAGTWMF